MQAKKFFVHNTTYVHTGVSTPVVVHVWCCEQKKKKRSPPSPLKGAPLGVLRSRWPPPGGPPLVSGPHLCFSPPLLFCLIAGAAREKIFWVYFLGFRGLVAKASATMLASHEGFVLVCWLVANASATMLARRESFFYYAG